MNIHIFSKQILIGIVSPLLFYLSLNSAQAVAQSGSDDRLHGTVVKTMDAGSYTYVQLDTGKEKLWAAGPVTTLTTGSMIAVSTRMPMTNFHSKSLDRDFELIYFVPAFITDKTQPQINSLSPHSTNIKTIQEPVTGINKADNGNTIAEILAGKKTLNGKSVLVRGKVIKYTKEVLNKNWIHIADSSGHEDLTITTDASAKIGDVILVSGVLTLNKDFGHGYRYDVIVQDASVTIE